MADTFHRNVQINLNQNTVITQKTSIWIYRVSLIQACTGKYKAREQKTITLQQFVPCLYTVSSGRTLQWTNTKYNTLLHIMYSLYKTYQCIFIKYNFGSQYKVTTSQENYVQHNNMAPSRNISASIAILTARYNFIRRGFYGNLI